ncbi:homeobox-leucine zipper protein ANTHOCYANINLESS 2-like [Solanum stenotomum]|uniref:homeobox-leucine zipper protein ANTHOCYANINLESS 2-like n=1 Tax=Solanum stenotomum TaxID=172797 RepID=UPI0020D0243B|nr:homeobox-leucine zipper protein ANTHOCYANINLESS 2-like [Solanum stenotomum]
MNFGDFLDNSIIGDGNGGGARIVTNSNNMRSNNNMSISTNLPSLAKSMFNSPRLSLALQTGREGGPGGVAVMAEENYYEANDNNNNIIGRGNREEEQAESRSGSDNLEVASGDDEDADNDKPQRKRKRYHRHTPQQIQQLESLFKECPHPDEKQRMELSRRLCLETRQVKFWFQNRRTQMKTQLERHENSFLRQENDKLRAENMSIREAIMNPICTTCSGPAIIGEVSFEEQHLRIENSRLKDELHRVNALAGKFIGGPISLPLPNSTLELQVGNNGFRAKPDFGVGISNPLPVLPHTRQTTGIEMSFDRSVYLELALAAMDELIKMAKTDDPLWLRNRELCGGEVLNHDEYMRKFTPCIGLKPINFVSEGSRETGMVIINSLALVETLMDSNKWAEMFPCLIASTSTIDVISSGVGGTRNGAIQLMRSELQVLSPLVPIREFKFLRFCKQHAEGVWAVVDVSVDTIRETTTFPNCRRLPSGCVVQDMPNGYSKITWVEHVEYDESVVHQLYRPLINAGMGFGAQKWVVTLQRQCECLAILMSSAVPSRDHTALTPSGRRSMLKLAQRMTNNFCSGVCASSIHKWNKLNCVGNNVEDYVRVLTRKSVDDPGEPPGIVVNAATSVWLPVSPQRLFDFLRDEQLRSEWDILSNGGPMQEMAHIAKGQDHGNCVSLLRANVMNASQNSMLILQETCTDALGSLVVYAPVDIPSMHLVMNGGDSAYVALLPSGFSIVPDGPGSHGLNLVKSLNNGLGPGPDKRVSGSLLTVAFQILVNSLPTAKLTLESVETVNNLISCTLQKIKGALHCES